MVMAELRRAFRPEFLNRLDETVMFHPLTKADLSSIIELLLTSLRKRLGERGLSLELSAEAKALIIDRGYDPVYGARPLRRVLQGSVETLIARRILSGSVEPGGTITVAVENGELICR
jgi:ATP-dependent Clp protease ATP-binding subunit ClpB